MTERLSAWPHADQFPRFLRDLLTGAIAQLRPGRPDTMNAASDDGIFGPGGLDIDSLERFTLAVAVAEALQLSRIQQPERLQAMNRLSEWVAEARRCLPDGTSSVGFRTSGSTGQAKFIAHEIGVLAQEIGSIGALFSDRTRIVSVVPAHHIYGFLFTVLLPMQLGIEAVDARAYAPTAVLAGARAGDLIVAVPGWWRLLTDFSWPADVAGASSGAPCPAAAAKALRRNGLRFVEVYGSTETSGIGWRDHDDAPFELFPYWERDGDQAIRKMAGGGARRYELPDLVTWQDHAHLTLAGRRDGAVQVGGVNIYPEAVRAVLLAHPDVADATVRLMRPDEGDRLKAFVVAKNNAAPEADLHRALEAWTAGRLAPMERPRAFTFGAALPANAMGKTADWTITGAAMGQSLFEE